MEHIDECLWQGYLEWEWDTYIHPDKGIGNPREWLRVNRWHMLDQFWTDYYNNKG